MITKGEIVLYTLSGADALAINRRRTDGGAIAARMKIGIDVEKGSDNARGETGPIYAWPAGAQAHIGNGVQEGQSYPAMVVALSDHGTAANLQVFLDGTDVFWATSKYEDGGKSPAPGTWQRRA